MLCLQGSCGNRTKEIAGRRMALNGEIVSPSGESWEGRRECWLSSCDGPSRHGHWNDRRLSACRHQNPWALFFRQRSARRNCQTRGRRQTNGSRWNAPVLRKSSESPCLHVRYRLAAHNRYSVGGRQEPDGAGRRILSRSSAARRSSMSRVAGVASARSPVAAQANGYGRSSDTQAGLSSHNHFRTRFRIQSHTSAQICSRIRSGIQARCCSRGHYFPLARCFVKHCFRDSYQVDAGIRFHLLRWIPCIHCLARRSFAAIGRIAPGHIPPTHSFLLLALHLRGANPNVPPRCFVKSNSSD